LKTIKIEQYFECVCARRKSVPLLCEI